MTLINLDLTLNSGQTSQAPWIKKDNFYQELVFIKDNPVLIKLDDKFNLDYEIPLSSDFKVKKKDVKSKVNEIFDINFDLEKFYSYLKEDENLAPACDFCSGLRLFLAKDKFESIISSISSSNNSIARWTKSIDSIKQKWGKLYEFPSGNFYSFPKQSTIKTCYIDDEEEFKCCEDSIDLENCINNLKSCGFGYRSRYIKDASRIFTLEMDLNEINKMSYDEAFKTILNVPGVGPKVADCILLYGYNFKEAFPSDVWIKRIVSYLYFDNEDIPVDKIREFGMDKFGDYAGYVQLYLFHYARKSGLMDKLKKK